MRRFCSILLLVILALVSIVFFVVTSVKMNLLTPRFLKNVLDGRGVFTLALQQADLQIERINLDPQIPITHAEISSLAREIVTEQWLQQNAEGLIDAFASWLETPPGTPLVLPVELGEVRDRLASALDAFLTRKLPELKPCPNSRTAKEEQGICRFAGLSVAQAKEQLAHAGLDINAFEKLIPDRIDLIRPDLTAITGPADPSNPEGAVQKSAKIEAQLEKAKSVYHQALQYFRYAWAGYGLLVALYLVLNGTGGWRRLVRWAGILLLSVSILPLAIAIASTPVMQQLLLPMIKLPDTFPVAVQSEMIAVVKDIRRAIFSPLFFTMIFLVASGLVGIIGAQWLPKPARR
ncbi:MAG: hypothetical protein HY340_01410 [Candidatus Kerfeldbacteria bacterium]|nr:hypothetical protein [Candidatus Kerfeldbacteria bacterium]